MDSMDSMHIYLYFYLCEISTKQILNISDDVTMRFRIIEIIYIMQDAELINRISFLTTIYS
jgi:hypothetical protein